MVDQSAVPHVSFYESPKGILAAVEASADDRRRSVILPLKTFQTLRARFSGTVSRCCEPPLTRL
jgi:hypothetical protein